MEADTQHELIRGYGERNPHQVVSVGVRKIIGFEL